MPIRQCLYDLPTAPIDDQTHANSRLTLAISVTLNDLEFIPLSIQNLIPFEISLWHYQRGEVFNYENEIYLHQIPRKQI